jgi:iron complex outermembrane receptor protein
MNSSKIAVRAAVSLALGLGAYARMAAGAETTAVTAEPSLEEIVITAQKRTEKLEDVAVAASVVSSDEILKQNAGDISDLNRLVPSVQLNGTINGRVPLGVRGISSVSNEGTVGLSSGVALMIDGVPIPSDSRAGNALEDVQSIEVLKGPQATLGGRSAATGVINIVTRQPTDVWSGNFNVSGTTDNEYRVNAFISGPIVDKLDFSLAGYYTSRDFPITNIQLDEKTKEKVQGVRGKLLFRPNDDLDIRLTARVGEDNSQGMNLVYTHITPGIQLLTGAGGPPWYPSQSQLLGGITPSYSNLKYSSPVDAYSDIRDTDGSIDVQYRIGGLTLASTTAYQDEKQTNVQDIFAVADYFWNILTEGGPGCGNACPPPFNNTQSQRDEVKQFSEELKLVSPVDQPFSYVVGLFYSDGKVIANEYRGLLPALLNVSVTPDTKTTDLYGRSTWKFSDDNALITGLRYNYDQISYTADETAYAVSFPPPVIVGPLTAADSSSSSAVVGDISFEHHFAPHSMGYLTYARGYSPAAYNTAQALTPSQPTLGQAAKENINHFELGTKGTYWDNRLTLNVAVFDTKYQDFQVQIFDQANTSINPPLILANAGGAETRGLEFDTAFAATEDLRLDFNAAYIDAKFTDYGAAPCYYPTSVAGLGFNPAGCFQVQNGAQVSGSGQKTVTGIPVVQNLSGATMPNSPKVKFTVSADQRIPLPGPVDIALDASYTWRDRTQMLVDQNPYGFQGSFGILNLSAGVADKGGHYSITAFVNNVFNKVYYTDIEDFWSSPWGGTDTVVGQPARDAHVYGGLRANYKF